MAYSDAQKNQVLAFYDDPMVPWMRQGLTTLTNEPEEVLGAGRERFERMLDEIPYVDRPDHSLADAIFVCGSILAVFEVLRERGVDAHALGRALHAIPSLPPGMEDQGPPEELVKDAIASQSTSAPNEFVLEVLGPDETRDFGMNIKSCAICHLFGKHDAMDLVPYMCAFDDALSDKAGQGLRRTGTIALGADHCDFRFKQGGEPLRLAEHYSDRIRLSDL